MQVLEPKKAQAGRSELDLRKVLTPASIAVVGASQDARRVGGEIVFNLKAGGFRGGVFPVNPKYQEIAGYTCYPALAAVQRPVDLAVIAVNAEQVSSVIRQCGDAGISVAMVLSSGFGESGTGGVALQRRLDQAAAESNVRIIGPNCIGLMNVRSNLYCGFGPGFRKHGMAAGPVAMVTQSGGFGFSVVGLCNAQGLGFSQVVSTGNESDISTADLIDRILDDDEIRVIVTYVEGVRDGRRFLQVGEKALALGKPILCWKVGNSSVGRRAAASHTANLSAPYDLFKVAFARSGYIEIREIEDLVDIARGFIGARLPKGKSVGVVTTSGGSGVLMADRCDEAGLDLPSLPPALSQTIAGILPPHSALSNPIDMTAQVGDDAARFNQVVKAFAQCADYDQVLVRYGAVQSPNAPAWAAELVSIANTCDKPVLVAWSRAPDRSSEALRILEEARLPWFVTPGRTVTAAAALSDFAHRRRRLSSLSLDSTEAIPPISLSLPSGARTLGEHASKQVVAAYGIPVARGKLFTLDELAQLERSPIRFPVVAKIESSDIPHKTEAGGVATAINSLSELKRAADRMVAAVRKYRSDAVIDGVLVQETCSGTEFMLGALVDECFGPVVIVGAGGIYAEVFKDVARQFAPVSKQAAFDMISELRAAPILSGYRGQPALDTEALADAIVRLGQLASQHQNSISEIDINPLFVGPVGSGVCAADALVVVRKG